MATGSVVDVADVAKFLFDDLFILEAVHSLSESKVNPAHGKQRMEQGRQSARQKCCLLGSCRPRMLSEQEGRWSGAELRSTQTTVQQDVSYLRSPLLAVSLFDGE